MSFENEQITISDHQTKLSKLEIILLILIILSMLGTLAVYLTFSSKLENTLSATNDQFISNNEKIDALQNKLQLCYEDKATSKDGAETSYSFSSFGIYSPLLEDKTVYNTVYDYKNSQIEVKSASFEYDGSNVLVSVWSVKKGSFYENNFPIFVGYENWGHPTFISELQNKWIGNKSYTNQHDMQLHYFYHYSPNAISDVSLEHFSIFSPLNKPIFVRIMMSLPDYTKNINDPMIIEAEQKLQEVADTFQVKL